MSTYEWDWTPVRRGAVYCSPSCGAKCTYAEFQLMTRRAAELCRQLGPGWKPRVKENLRWYFDVINKRAMIVIHVSYPQTGDDRTPSYWADMAGADFLESPIKQLSGEGDSATEALREVLIAAMNQAALLNAAAHEITRRSPKKAQNVLSAPRVRASRVKQ